MRIPKKIKIGSHIYRVQIVDSIDENPNKMGESHHSKLQIRIRKGELSMMENTFIHELIHCFNTEFNDELLHQSLTDGLQNFIKDNPKVL